MSTSLRPQLLRVLLALPLVACSGMAAPAQEAAQYLSPAAHPLPLDTASEGLWQSLQRLHTRGSLLMVVAHPDDEDGGMLTYESRGEGVDTSLLTLNRGEGGQNVMTSDFWDQLGELRTQELLAAGRFYGVHQYFTRVADFGFSKTIEEAYSTWGHERVLRDAVRVVRTVRPLVVASTFAGNVSDGHGHHQVSGAIAQEVFNAAADPKMFPEQIKEGLLPWAPLRVYARVPFARVTEKGIYDYATGHWSSPVRFRNYATGTWIDGIPSADVEIPSGTFNPLLGASYLQLAREGLNRQMSQNGGIATPLYEPETTPYHLYASRVPPAGTRPSQGNRSSFFDGIDTSILAIASYAPADQRAPLLSGLQAIAAAVDTATRSFDPLDPAKSAPGLAIGLRATEGLLQQTAASPLPADARYNIVHELAVKQAQFNTALVQALGLDLVAIVSAGGGGAGNYGPMGNMSLQLPSSQTVTAGESFRVALHLANTGTVPVEVESGDRLLSHDGSPWPVEQKTVSTEPLGPHSTRTEAMEVTVPADVHPTAPYFSRPNLEQSFYDISDPANLTQPTSPYPLEARVTFRYGGVPITLRGVVQTVRRIPAIGPVTEPLLVVPAISLTVSPTAGVVRRLRDAPRR